jgi:hypothetical protein
MLDAQTQFAALDGAEHQMSEPPRSCANLNRHFAMLFKKAFSVRLEI